MNRLVGVNSNCYHNYSIENAIAGIHAAGFRYVELTATKGWTEHVFPSNSFSRLLEVRGLLENYGLIPIALSGHCNLADSDRIPDFIENIELASFFQCNYIISSIGEAHVKEEHEVTTEEAVRNISALVPLLEKKHMILALETHGIYGTGEKLKQVTDQIGSKYVKINYDTANVIYYGKADPAEDLSVCVQDVVYMHLKDKAGKQSEWNFPALGQGKIDFKGILKVLEKNHNDCPFSIEIEFTKDGPGTVDTVDQAVMESGEYLRWLEII